MSDEPGYYEVLSNAQKRDQARRTLRRLLYQLERFKPWEATALEIRKALPLLERVSRPDGGGDDPVG